MLPEQLAVRKVRDFWMRKSAQKSAPVSLGTKRTCPRCATKFYDFNKEEVACPKCDTKVDLANPNYLPRGGDTKKGTKAEKALTEPAALAGEDLAVGDSDESFESVDDLDDEEEDLVEEIEVDEDEKEDF